MDMNRLEKFILLLGSDQAGEVTAAAGMLVRALKKDGKDLHDMVRMMNGGARTAPPPPPRGNQDQIIRLVAEIQGLKNTVKVQKIETAQLHKMNDDLRRQLQVLQNTLNMMQYTQAKPQTATEAHRQDMDDLQRWAQGFTKHAYKPQQTADDWRAQAEWALAYGWRYKLLSEWEYEFLTDMTGTAKHYDLSYKQLSKIEDIYTRLRRVEASRG